MSFIYPETCVACEYHSSVNGSKFCVKCLSKVNQTDHFENDKNDLLFRCLTRVEAEKGAALYAFLKGGLIQSAIHQIKYRKRQDIAYHFGQEFGSRMLEAAWETPDVIVPIPLHWRRQRQRGYNQSERFATGISDMIGSRVITNALIKSADLKSITGLNRENRFHAVLASFSLRNKKTLQNKRVLLVDDVMTTGATIEAAWLRLKEVPGIKLQVGIIALADG